MSNQNLPLKTRVRYEGRAQIFDRRAKVGADLDKIPDPVWHTVGLVLRTQLRRSANDAVDKPARPNQP